MIAFGLREPAMRGRRRVSAQQYAKDYDFAIWKSDWMASGQEGVVTPSMFLVEQDPGSVLRTHYHRQNQFQLFVRGSGNIGPHALSPYTLHYAGAYTGYGPITAGPEGLAYFTIRATFDSGAGFVPEALGSMLRGPRKQATAGPFMIGGASDLAQQANEITRELMGSDQDDLHAQRHLLPPTRDSSIASRAAGVFGMILRGDLQVAGERLREWESFYLSPDEAPATVTSGTDGCEFITLRMPALVAEYRNPTLAGTVR